MIRFHVVNVPLSCLSVLRENLVSFVDYFLSSALSSQAQQDFPVIHFSTAREMLCPRHLICSQFPYETRHFPQKWHLTAPAMKLSLKPVPMQPLKDSTCLTSDLQPCKRHQVVSDQLSEARIQSGLPVSLFCFSPGK